ncbi:unnamed protein product [Adineta ricciae]|uniref:Uncharacterized protein n=1 Tax=Adineta ricciae TaxID=249248 RepID=A0A813PV39_ADIRI|nr:unnamed protein product [Adineta ricciae]CAF1084931.1 unnamed protein product [Adineta ricciae]
MNTPTSVSPSNNNIKRLPTNQHFLATTSTDLNVVSSTIRNDCSSPQSHTSPIISDVCMSSQNSVRNPSTMMKFKDVDSSNGNHFNEKYAFTLDFSSPVSKTKSEHNRTSQNYTFEMSTNDEQDLHSPFELDVPICENQPVKKIQNDFLIDRMLKDETNSNYSSQHRSINQSSYTNVLNHSSPLVTPSSDHHDIDALSDAGTYIIEDDLDIAHDDEPEQDIEEPPPQQQQQHNDTQESISSPLSTSSPFKRYATTKRNRHGTFDIHGISSSSSTATSTHAVTRPIVDLNIPTHDLSSPSSSSSANLSSSSSLLSLPTESENSIRKEREDVSHKINGTKSSNGLTYVRQRPNTLLSQRPITPPQNQIKPAECFVISPTLDTKPFPNNIGNGSRRKLDAQWKTKLSSSAMPTKDTNVEILTKKSPPSPQLSTHSNQSDTDRYSFRLRQQPRNPDAKPQPSRYLETKTQQPSVPATNAKSSYQNSEYTSSKSTLRPHSSTNDQSYSSPFQRNATIRQTMPASTQYNRPMSSSTTNKYLDDHEEVSSTHPSLTKVYMNKSFALRRQRSNLVPSGATATAKPGQQQQQQQPQQSSQQSLVSRTLPSRQLLKSTPSAPSANNSGGQTNRAVELRRARAQAKIEELAQRTRHQLQKSEQQNDLMSASWHSNASSTSKKDLFGLRANPRSTNNNHLSAQKQDLSKTRTISSSSHHRSSSASPNPLGETMTSSMPTKPSKYRKGMTSSVTDETQYQRMHGSTFSEGDRCESLRDDGQRLAIKLIQLSSGILAKLKPHNITDDNDSNVRELEQLVDQLQTVNRTLTTIDASLNGPISDESLI